MISLSVEEGSIRALFLEIDDSYGSLGTLNDNGPVVVSGNASLERVALGGFSLSLAAWPEPRYLCLARLHRWFRSALAAVTAVTRHVG